MRIHFAKPRRWGGMAVASVLALVVAISGLILVQGDVSAAGTFDPVVGVDLSDYESDANADITTLFEVPGTDYNYKTLVSFTPSEFFVDTSDVPIGAKVGELDSLATLGLLNGACNTPLAPHFDLLWASTDPSDTCTFDEQFLDCPPPVGTGTLCRGVQKYPDMVGRILPGITPVQRLFGATSVSGSLVSINFLILEAGDLPGYPAAWGRPSVTILNDIGDPAALPTPGDPITDFCTPLSSETVNFGMSQDNSLTPANEAGYELRQNPACGDTYTFSWYTASMPDADGDGYENYGDTCPFVENLENFKETAGHPDSDGIDSACEIPLGGENMNCWPGAPGLDPGGSFLDCDDDGFTNRVDNCPLVPNGCDTSECHPTKYDPTWDRQADTDVDDIGDACDTEGNGPTVADGTPIERTLEADVEISGPPCGGEEATPTPTPSPSPTVVAVDTDGDTVPDEDEELYGSDPEDAESMPENLEYDPDTCSDDVDNDGDGLTDDEDPGCEVVEATPTPTVQVEICAPVFPGTYNGFVRIDGQPATSGYEVTASIDGMEWGSDIISGGRYAVDIPDYMPSEPPCFEGGTITFAVDGMTCTPTAEWASGIQTVDLECAPAAPPATPSPTVTPPPATPTPQVTPTAPPPSGAGGLSGSDPGLPLWAMALASWAGLTIVAGLGTLLAVKRG
jgi:hypothetical protein